MEGSNPRSNRRIELGEVLREAPPRIGRARVLDGEAHHRCAKQALDLGHGRDQALSLAGAEGLEQTGGELVGSSIELRAFGEPGRGELGPSDPSIGLALGDPDERLVLEGPQHTARVA